jgi:prolyl-tRNA editing enzyme YbaK/EbsC (Cys-tRNA(Pro) deacylase)
VKTVLLSGLRATVVMESGKHLDEAKLKADIEARRLTFVSLSEVTVPRPKAAYVVAVSGAT